MFHPNSNKRYRLGLRQLCKRFSNAYRHGVPQKPQTTNNGHKPYDLKVIQPNGQTVFYETVSVKSPYGEKCKLVAHYGLSENLPHLFSFS